MSLPEANASAHLEYPPAPMNGSRWARLFFLFLPAILFSLFLTAVSAQTGGHIIYGDFNVDESKATGVKPISFDLILRAYTGRVMARQTVSNNGRYRFMDVANGDYDIVVEVENSEVARIHILVQEIKPTDIRHDISLEWREDPRKNRAKPASTSPVDFYNRTAANKKRFEKAEEAITRKDYLAAGAMLKEILAADPKDYQALTELGTVYLLQNQLAEAEKAYEQAILLQPAFLLALLDLGKLRLAQKNYEAAIDPLTQAVKVQPASADANYQLGEAYLQIKKGSKAVEFLYEALRLEPIRMADAHLRLALLYNAAGMKNKAVIEYEQFLKKKPDYADRKRLEKYIAENKKP